MPRYPERGIPNHPTVIHPLRSLWRSGPLCRWGLAILGGLGLTAIAAPVLAPYSPSEQLDPAVARSRPPGTLLYEIHMRTAGVDRWLLAEGVERQQDTLLVERRGRVERLPVAAVVNLEGEGKVGRRLYLLGTDRFGRDICSRIIYGTRISFTTGCLSVALALSLGVCVGGLAAVGGPVVDGVLMRVVDAFLSFPRIFLVLALAALFTPSTWLVILLLGGTGWMGMSRLIRAEILGLLKRDFVVAAQGLGQNPVRVFLRHLLPNALTPVLVSATLSVGDAILAEATLSFVGLGIQPPAPSWGNMISDGRTALLSAWWTSTLPGIAVVVTVVGFNLVGDGLRDAADPRGP